MNKSASISSQILRRLFGTDESSCFSYESDSEERERFDMDTFIENWRFIEDKLKEFSHANEQLSSSLTAFGRAIVNFTKAKQSLQSGMYSEGSREWNECERFASDIDQYLPQGLEDITNLDRNVIGIFESLKYTLDQQMNILLAKMNEWKAAQRLALLGGPEEKIESALNDLAREYTKMEHVIETLSQLIYQYSMTITQISKWCGLCPVTLKLYKERTTLSAQMQNSIRQRHHNLVQKVLAGESYGLRGSSVEIEILLITEKQAKDIARKTLDPLQEKMATPGLLSGPRVILQPPIAESDGQMSAVFRGVRVQAMNKRSDEDSDVISLPFAVLSNAHRQDKYTRARMFWQMSFKIHDETSLATATHGGKDGNEIRWQEFLAALDLWFRHTTRCKEGLNIHWQYIAEKIAVTANHPDALVTWDAFYKKKSGDWSFWDWFCPIADCVAKMPAYWDSGLILGFASRQTAEHYLQQASLPSMIIRFSETSPGNIVVSYVAWNQQAIIEHVLFDEKANKALAGKTLAECIRHSVELQSVQYILPTNRPMNELFALDALNAQRTCESEQKSTSGGYVRPRVALVWREPPMAPECLLNSSMDGSFDSSPYSTFRSPSECLTDMELEAAATNLTNYLLSDEMPPRHEPFQ